MVRLRGKEAHEPMDVVTAGADCALLLVANLHGTDT